MEAEMIAPTVSNRYVPLLRRTQLSWTLLLVAVGLVGAMVASLSWRSAAEKTVSAAQEELLVDLLYPLISPAEALLTLAVSPLINEYSEPLPNAAHYTYYRERGIYRRHPQFGYQLDLCGGRKNQRPLILWYGNTPTLTHEQSFDWYSCALVLLLESWQHWSGRGNYLQRRDTALARVFALKQNDYPEIVSPMLQNLATRQFPVQTRARALNGFRIKFATYRKHVTGRAVFHIESVSGAELQQVFDLGTVGDNDYHYFELPPGHYRRAWITDAQASDKIIVWEVRTPQRLTACTLAEYVGGFSVLTPGCIQPW